MAKRLVAAVLAALVFVGLVLGWAQTGHCSEKKPKPDEAFISVSPKVSLGGFGGSEVFLRVRIPVVTEKSYCPAIEINIKVFDELVNREVHESDCEPWTSVPYIKDKVYHEATNKPYFWSKHYVFGQGQWEFAVTLSQGKWRQRLTATVEVR